MLLENAYLLGKYKIRKGESMLKNLSIKSIEPSGIMAMIAQLNGEILEDKTYFEKYIDGVYRHDGFKFNFDSFIEDNTFDTLTDKWVTYGVCDSYEQVLELYENLLSDPDKNYVIGLSTVRRKDQSSDGGWRWHKWGEYIGTQNPQHEYLYDDTHIDEIYCYHIYEIA